MPEHKRLARGTYSLVLVCLLLIVSLAACGSNGNSGNGAGSGSAAGTANGNISTPTPSSSAGTSAGSPLTVTGVDMAVSPTSLSGYACGAQLTVTYTATFHFSPNNAGGQVLFQYTTNNGRAGTQASLTVSPGQTTVPYQFTWSGTLPADHTMPEPGGVIVSSPNPFTSSLLGPAGVCSASSTGVFQVLSASVTASPSLTGHTCGTLFTETYTAVFHIAANSPGGTIVFNYTVNNGRSNSQNINLHVVAGQTSAVYKFHWTGLLPPDHTAPGVGIVQVLAPNQMLSSSGVPAGQCTLA